MPWLAWVHFFEASSWNCARCSTLCHGYRLVIKELIPSTWWGFQNQPTAHRRWLRVLSIAFEEELRGPWLCLMTKLYYFSCLLFFASVFFFFLSVNKFILWLTFFYSQKAGEGHQGGVLSWESPIGSCTGSMSSISVFKLQSWGPHSVVAGVTTYWVCWVQRLCPW